MTTTKTPRAKPAPRPAELSHVEGCPGERIEAFTTADAQGAEVKVTRCLDCAAATYERE